MNEKKNQSMKPASKPTPLTPSKKPEISAKPAETKGKPHSPKPKN